MLIAGIDPGVSGALFFLCSSPFALDVPTLKQKVAGKKSPRVVPDYHTWMSSWGEALAQADHIYVEQVQGGTFAGKGNVAHAGMFKFGYTAGFIRGIVVASKRPYSFISPHQWKKIAGLPKGSEKDDARARACQLIPGAAQLLTRKMDVGRADAGLIAWAGYRRDHA